MREDAGREQVDAARSAAGNVRRTCGVPGKSKTLVVEHARFTAYRSNPSDTACQRLNKPRESLPSTNPCPQLMAW